MTHTPGPWTFENQSELCGPEPDCKTILSIGGGYDGLWGGDYPTEANAQLIAAAPELLDACKAAASHIAEEVQHLKLSQHPVLESLKAVIAKAERVNAPRRRR